MSAHEWPEFEKHPEYDEWIVDTVALTKDQYNYAKVRIDGYDALQQRCEELVAEKLVLEDKLKMYKAFYDAN